MGKPKMPGNIEEDQKLDRTVANRLAKVIEVLSDLED
jgi:hypothetical protein